MFTTIFVHTYYHVLVRMYEYPPATFVRSSEFAGQHMYTRRSYDLRSDPNWDVRLRVPMYEYRHSDVRLNVGSFASTCL